MLTHNAEDPGRAVRRKWLHLTLVALMCSLAGVIATTGLLIRQAEATMADAAVQADLSIRLRQLQTVLVALADAETGQRGYLLTGKSSALEPYKDAVARLPLLLTALDHAPLSDPALQARADQARKFIDLRLGELAEALQLHQQQLPEAALQRVMSEAGQAHMDSARGEVNAVLNLVRGERDRLADKTAAGYARSRQLLMWTVSSLVLFIALAAAQTLMTLSARTRFESRLAESEQSHRAIVEDQSEMLSLAREDGSLVYVNPAYSRHFGMQPTALSGCNLYDHVEPQDLAAVKAQIADVLRTGDPRRGENRTRTPDGIEQWIAWTNSRQRDAGGAFLLHSVGRDVTERVLTERKLRELTEILDHTSDYVVQSNHRGIVQYLNAAVRRALGMSLTGPIGHHHFAEFVTPETQRRFVDEIVPAALAHGVWVGETTIYVAQQRVVPVSHMVIAHRDADGRVSRFSAVLRDISQVLEARQLLLRQTATLRSVTEAIPAMVAVVGTDGHYRFVNTALERWIGLPRERIVGQSMVDVLGRTEYEASLPWMQRALSGETVSFQKKDAGRGSVKHLGISFVPLWDDRVVEGFIAVAQDITHHKEEEGRLLQLAQRDALTGLLNRTGVEAYLDRKTEDGSADAMALLYVDLDHFKPVNDRHGHPVGDQVLRLFAQRMLALVRPTDAVARLGGDEFAVVLSGVREQAHAELVADKIVAGARQPFEIGDITVAIGASVGVAFQAERGTETGWQGLVQQADARLYQAKAGGRGRRV